jgi:dipeptidyl aminopeptidase/acylaminoacyl peptidase
MNRKLATAFCIFLLFIAPGGARAAGTENIPPNENLVADGVPAISRELAGATQRYTEYRSAAFRNWHPVKREMLIGTRFADTTQIHRVKFPGGARAQLTFSRDRTGGGTYDPRDAAFMLIRRDAGGGEYFQIYRQDFADGRVTLLTDGKSRNTGGAWSNSGDLFAYESTRRTGRDTDICVIDPRDPATDRLVAPLEGGGWMTLDWSPDDRTLLVLEYKSINESTLWLVDVATGKRTRVTMPASSEPVSNRDARFSADGKGIFAATDRDSEFSRLAYIDLASGKHRYLTSGADVDDLELSRDRRRIALVENRQGAGRLRVIDAGSGRDLKLPAMPLGIVSGIGWHANGRDLGFTFGSAREPGDAWSIDVDAGTLTRWTESESGGIVLGTLPEPRLIEWNSFDGRAISGFHYRPPASFIGRRPVIIDIHGGPEAQARPRFIGRDNYLLNELGVAIIFPNVRGSAGFGKTFVKLDNGFLRDDSYKDIAALIDWIADQPDLDRDRIMVMGGSYGGHMTLAVAAFYSDRIRCALSVVGMSNLVSFLENTAGYRQDLRRVEYGDERDPKMREYLAGIAPLNRAGQIRKPLFVVQGANDPRVPRSESEQIVATLKSSNTPVWYLMAKDEGHGFAKKANRDFQFYSTVMFVREHLLK